MKRIKTGADKLIEIIQESKKISLEDASKALGVSKDIVREWAEFLERERLISIDYSFSKVYFTERKLSAKEMKQSAKEIVYEKDAFVNKVEYAIASLERESVNFEEIKKKFSDVQEGVKKELKIVEKELADLEKYNKLKTNVDREIEEQKKKFKTEISNLDDELKKRESDYLKIYTKIVKEKEAIDEHKKRISSLQKAQKDISDSIKSANEVLFKLKKDLSHEESVFKSRVNSFDKLKAEFNALSERVVIDKKKKIGTISSLFEKETKKLSDRQDALLKDAKRKASKLESYEYLGKKIKGSFEGFFDKTIRISKKIDEIDKEKDELRRRLLSVKEKARALKLMSSNANLKSQAREIDAEIKKQEEAKGKLFKKIRSLLDDLKV